MDSVNQKQDEPVFCPLSSGIQNGEYLLRMSFLVQAAKLVSDDSLLLGRHYASEAKHIAKRHVLRLDPAVKCMFCKRCSTPLDQ